MRRTSWRFKLSALAGELELLAKKENKEASAVAEVMASELQKIVWTQPKIPKRHLADIVKIIENGIETGVVSHPKKWRSIVKEIRALIKGE